MKTLKFTQGPIIDNMDALCRIVSGDEYVYLDDRPKHPKFMRMMTLRVIRKLVHDKRLRVAVPNDR